MNTYASTYGTITIAIDGYRQADRAWYRIDGYESFSPDGIRGGRDRIWCVDRHDTSRQTATGTYDGKCGWCYLGVGHTENEHARKVTAR